MLAGACIHAVSTQQAAAIVTQHVVCCWRLASSAVSGDRAIMGTMQPACRPMWCRQNVGAVRGTHKVWDASPHGADNLLQAC